MLPNFLCIGAQKAGTTTLWLLLNQHPDVFLATPRETRFFYDDLLYSSGANSYERNFFHAWEGQKAVGEKTPAYLFFEKTPGRIRDTLGADVKLIVALRSPAQRAHSHFRHNYQQFWESLGFDEALEREPERTAEGELARSTYGYLARGRYVEQLKRYYDIFPRENILVLIFEKDIVGNQEQLMSTLFRFLGVDDDIPMALPVSAGRPNIPEIEIVQNSELEYATKGETFFAPQGSLLLRLPGGVTRCIRNPSPQFLDYARDFCANAPKEERLSRETELEINLAYFKDEISSLSDLIDCDLSSWIA